MTAQFDSQDELFGYTPPSSPWKPNWGEVVPLVRDPYEHRPSAAYQDLGGHASPKSLADDAHDISEPPRLSPTGEAQKRNAILDARWTNDSSFLLRLQNEMREDGLSSEEALRRWNIEMGLRAVRRARVRK